MKKIITLLLIIFTMQGFAQTQDTTSLRWIGQSGWYQELHYFANDTVVLPGQVSSYNTSHGIFMNNADSLIYTILNNSTEEDRNLYTINPFDGTFELVHDLTVEYLSSSDISEDGMTLYGVVGQAGTTPGEVYSIDITTWVETPLTTATAVNGQSFALEFHPPDSSLYIFSGNWDTNEQMVQKIDLETLSNVSEVLTGGIDPSNIAGALWSGVENVFYLTENWGSYLSVTDGTTNNLTYIIDLPYGCHDIVEFYTLRREADVIGLCPNVEDSTLLSSIYPFDAIKWFMDDIEMAETNDSIWVSEPGAYQALFPIADGNFMWSEIIVVNYATVPVVTITQTEGDNLICDGEFIILTGADGGTLQWFFNSEIIPDANGSTYDAGEIGLYNQMKTNLSGCSNTSEAAYEIFEDPDCGIGINDLDYKVNIFPNPVDDMLMIESTTAIESITIYDITGRRLYQKITNNTKEIVNLESIDKGTYLINIKTKEGAITKTFFK